MNLVYKNVKRKIKGRLEMPPDMYRGREREAIGSLVTAQLGTTRDTRK